MYHNMSHFCISIHNLLCANIHFTFQHKTKENKAFFTSYLKLMCCLKYVFCLSRYEILRTSTSFSLTSIKYFQQKSLKGVHNKVSIPFVKYVIQLLNGTLFTSYQIIIFIFIQDRKSFPFSDEAYKHESHFIYIATIWLT